jgi:hypothetical protein
MVGKKNAKKLLLRSCAYGILECYYPWWHTWKIAINVKFDW